MGVKLRYKGRDDGGGYIFERGPTTVRFEVGIEAGTVRLLRMQLSSRDITSDLLRKIDIGQVKKRISAELPRRFVLEMDGGRIRPLSDYVRRISSRRGPGRLTDEFLAEVALDYLRMLEKEPRRPILAMAERRMHPPVTVSSWVQRCRRDGWLTKATPGRAGATPGPKLIEWLEQQEDR